MTPGKRGGRKAAPVEVDMNSNSSVRTLILGMDRSGRIVQHDRTAPKILACSAGKLLGVHLSDITTSDAVNTLLVYERMLEEDRNLYRAFGIAEYETPAMRPTLGARVATLLTTVTHTGAAAGSDQNLKYYRHVIAIPMANGPVPQNSGTTTGTGGTTNP